MEAVIWFRLMNQLLILLSLFLVIFAGTLSIKYKLFSEEASKYFNKFIFYVTVPVAIFLSLVTLDVRQISGFFPFVAINTIIIFIGYILTFYFLKLFAISKDKKGVIIFAGNGGNVIYFGFPILLALYGQEHFNLGVIYAAIVISIGDLMGFYLLGVNRGEGKINLKKELLNFLTNPIVVATFLGVISAILEVPLPQFLLNSLETIAKTTTGLALFSLGIYLYGKLNFSDFKYNLLSTSIKLIFLPLLTYVFVYWIFRMDSVAAETSVLLAAMPSAVFSLSVAEAYDLDRKLTSNTIILSSLLFLLTSGLWVWILQLSH
jgi:predicted permease